MVRPQLQDVYEMTDDNKGHMFQPGVSGNPAGRPKDSLSRPNMLKRSRELGIAPEDFLLYFAAGNCAKLGLKEGDITPNMRLKAIIESLKKMVPDLKAIEHNVNTDPERDGSERTVVILPSNSRELAEDEFPIPLADIEEGITEAIKSQLKDDE